MLSNDLVDLPDLDVAMAERGINFEIDFSKKAPKVKTEYEEQKALVKWASDNATKIPQLAYLFAVPNGIPTSQSQANMAKASGLKKGVPDLFLAYPSPAYAGLFIEMKRTINGKVSKEQEIWITKLQAVGYRVEVCKGYIEAKNVILNYLGVK